VNGVKHPCPWPRCPELLEPGVRYCPTHTRQVDRPRGSSQARGYDQAWTRLRERHATMHPLCARCWARGRVEPMVDVDHIVPFVGLTDPRRLDPANLMSLCRRCHREKTHDEQGTRHRGASEC